VSDGVLTAAAPGPSPSPRFTTTTASKTSRGDRRRRPRGQVSTVTLSGDAIELGDSYSVTVNGTTHTYEADGTEGSINDVAAALSNQINAGAKQLP